MLKSIIDKINKPSLFDVIRYNCKPDNTKEIEKFVGGFWVCDKCGGYGEYEGEYGPVGCNLCNSRLLPFVDRDGKVVTADWGDDIIRDEDGGLRLVVNDCMAIQTANKGAQ